MFFLVTDAHSKWPEVSIMSSTTAVRTISVLREMFSRLGIPEQLVSDNGPQFLSDEFKQFMTANRSNTSEVPHITELQMGPRREWCKL